jgi:hypothetical protein
MVDNLKNGKKIIFESETETNIFQFYNSLMKTMIINNFININKTKKDLSHQKHLTQKRLLKGLLLLYSEKLNIFTDI